MLVLFRKTSISVDINVFVNFSKNMLNQIQIHINYLLIKKKVYNKY